MKKHNLLALLLAALLLLGGCAAAEKPMESAPLLEQIGGRAAEGNFFFTAKILSAKAERRQISYYDTETEKNTFYKIEITDDFYGVLPDRVMTLCVMGSSENFAQRVNLKKDREYILTAALWMLEEESILLLPTFYHAMPERREDALYYEQEGEEQLLDLGYEAYKDALMRAAEKGGYSAKSLLQRCTERLEDCAARDALYFKKNEFKNIDKDALAATAAAAKERLALAEKAAKTWSGIEGVLK